MSTGSPLQCIGVGIDTARYGHRVSFMRPDRLPAAKPLTVLENQAGYQALRERLEQLQLKHPQAQFHVRIDAAGQYAANLEAFLRGLPLPTIISIGEPKRNKDYQKAHFPKRTSDDTESQAMARFAVVEQPAPTLAAAPAFVLLHELAGRLQARVKQTRCAESAGPGSPIGGLEVFAELRDAGIVCSARLSEFSPQDLVVIRVEVALYRRGREG